PQADIIDVILVLEEEPVEGVRVPIQERPQQLLIGVGAPVVQAASGIQAVSGTHPVLISHPARLFRLYDAPKAPAVTLPGPPTRYTLRPIHFLDAGRPIPYNGGAGRGRLHPPRARQRSWTRRRKRFGPASVSCPPAAL